MLLTVLIIAHITGKAFPASPVKVKAIVTRADGVIVTVTWDANSSIQAVAAVLAFESIGNLDLELTPTTPTHSILILSATPYNHLPILGNAGRASFAPCYVVGYFSKGALFARLTHCYFVLFRTMLCPIVTCRTLLAAMVQVWVFVFITRTLCLLGDILRQGSPLPPPKCRHPHGFSSDQNRGW